MNRKKQTVETELESLQRDTFRYFLLWTNPQNGLVRDKTETDWPASIAATGLALASYPVAVERGFITRAAAIATVLATLRFFRDSPQGPESDATGHHGFYYHFLDMQTGRRAWQCELSTVDSAILLAGALTAGAYFDADTAEEKEIRAVADALYRRVDWPWAQNGGLTVTHGWKPESGFLKYRWQGYDEALVLYILGLGSPTLRCQRAATWRGLPLTSGKIAADTIIFTPGRCSRIKFRISGSIFVAFRTRSCAKKASTTSRTPAARLMRSNNMRSTTR